MIKSGFVTILGRPNAGKSSLMNALVGEKVSIVSPKAQTTRDRIMGILTGEDFQIVFVDTPGIHAAKTQLGEYMSKCVNSASDGADATVIVVDASRGLSAQETELIEKHGKSGVPLFVAVNKIDLVGFERTYPLLDKLSPFLSRGVKELIPVSCKTGQNLDKLLGFLKGVLPEGEFFFPADEITDKSERYMICEIIREKALLFLQDEIPHGIGVTVAAMESGEKLVNIEADIVAERDSHKQIIIGEGGEMLKRIGTSARADIEALLDNKVFLKLFVKVREDWRNKKSYLSDIGYDKKNV